MQLFFPQLFDPQSPSYVDPDILTQLISLAESARPPCLSDAEQDLAQAYFTAYLVTLRNDTSSGTTPVVTSGPVTSEKEGDIQITYADVTSTGSTGTQSKRPPSDPWDVWSRMWMRCARGAILTRFGDPCSIGGVAFTNQMVPLAYSVWRPVW